MNKRVKFYSFFIKCSHPIFSECLKPRCKSVTMSFGLCKNGLNKKADSTMEERDARRNVQIGIENESI